MGVLRRWRLWSVAALGVVVVLLRLTAFRLWKVPEGDPYLDASGRAEPEGRGLGVALADDATRSPVRSSCARSPSAPRACRRRAHARRGSPNHVKIDGTHVYVNEKVQAAEGSCADEHFKVIPPGGGAEVEQRCSMEVASGVAHPRGEAEATAELPAYEVDLKRDEVVLVSDNRRFPYDSRDYGPVVRDSCTDTIFFRLLGVEGFFDASRRFQYVR